MYSIINRYIFLSFLKHLLTIIFLVTFILIVFDFIELARVSANKSISILKVFEMSVYKVPIHVQKIFGFLILISSVITYSKLNKGSELIVMKASGISIWQVAFPSIVAAFFVGCFFTAVLNPIASSWIKKYEKMEASYLKGHASLLSISKTGLWIKQQNEDNTETIIHALRIVSSSHELMDVTFYFRDENGAFLSRLDAESAKLSDGEWILKNVIESSEESLNVSYAERNVPTDLTFTQIQENMVMPETISFWKLSSFISVAENSGLSVIKHKLYLYKLFIAPMFFVAAVLLGMSFSISNARYKKMNVAYFICFATGFAIYFTSDILTALAASGAIDSIVASLVPTVVMTGVGAIILLHFEEIRS